MAPGPEQRGRRERDRPRLRSTGLEHARTRGSGRRIAARRSGPTPCRVCRGEPRGDQLKTRSPRSPLVRGIDAVSTSDVEVEHFADPLLTTSRRTAFRDDEAALRLDPAVVERACDGEVLVGCVLGGRVCRGPRRHAVATTRSRTPPAGHLRTRGRHDQQLDLHGFVMNHAALGSVAGGEKSARKGASDLETGKNSEAASSLRGLHLQAAAPIAAISSALSGELREELPAMVM